MKTAGEIYAAYKISPFLQLHQLRVAAVAKTIADHFDGTLDTRALLIAALFHDMGNIIKFDLSHFPETSEPEGVAYWQKVKDDFIRRYGPDEHHATIAIAHELHLPLQAVLYIDGVGFSKLEKTRDTHSVEQKIVEYGDLRVAPQGVTSMSERLTEARERYKNHSKSGSWDADRYQALVAAAKEIEEQIFARTSISPTDITEEKIQPLIGALRDFNIG